MSEVLVGGDCGWPFCCQRLNDRRCGEELGGDVRVEEMTTTNVLGQEAVWEQRGDQWT